MVKEHYSSVDGLAAMTDFTYDNFSDLIQTLPERHSSKSSKSSVEIWTVICLLLAENANRRNFFRLG